MTLDQFKQTYEDWKLSGLSVRDYCNNTGFDEGKFYYWRRKLTDSALPDTQGFVPVRMNNLNGKLNITTASKEIESKSDSECEIIYANGDAFIFINKSLTNMKILHAEYGGLVIYNMRLESGTFRLSDIDCEDSSASLSINWSELTLIVHGISPSETKRAPRWSPKKE